MIVMLMDLFEGSGAATQALRRWVTGRPKVKV